MNRLIAVIIGIIGIVAIYMQLNKEVIVKKEIIQSAIKNQEKISGKNEKQLVAKKSSKLKSKEKKNASKQEILKRKNKTTLKSQKIEKEKIKRIIEYRENLKKLSSIKRRLITLNRSKPKIIQNINQKMAYNLAKRREMIKKIKQKKLLLKQQLLRSKK